MQLSLFLPVKPFVLNQAFGNNIPCVRDYGLSSQSIVDGADNSTCPVGYTKLYQVFGMKGHDGADLQAGVQNIYASCDGVVIEKQTIARLGLGIGIITLEPVDLGTSGTHYAKIRTWHMKSFAVDVGQAVKAGDLIGVSDNTGYSSGNHCHWEVDPMDKDSLGNYVLSFPNNGYAGAIDPMPFWNKEFAQDIPKLISLNTALVGVLTQLLNYLKSKS